METNIDKKAFKSISDGLQMLSENKVESLSALAEISIILGSSRVTEYNQISEEVNPFLATINYLLKDLNKESVLLIQKFIENIDKNGVESIDYKTKYDNALEEIYSLNKEIKKLKA